MAPEPHIAKGGNTGHVSPLKYVKTMPRKGYSVICSEACNLLVQKVGIIVIIKLAS